MLQHLNLRLRALALGCLTAGAAQAMATATPQPPIWRSQKNFEPISHTAEAITGALNFSGAPDAALAGSPLKLRFARGKPVVLTSVGMATARWQEFGDIQMRSAEIFRLDHDPGRLNNGNRLCGGAKDPPARYIVLFQSPTPDAGLLSAAVFQSAAPPQNIDSPGLCGTFSYDPVR